MADPATPPQEGSSIPSGLPKDFRHSLAQIAASAPGVLYSYILEPDGSSHFLYLSAAVERVFGIPSDELSADAESVFRLIHPDDLARIRQSIRESADTLGKWEQKFRIRHSEKGEVWLRGTAMPRREPDGSTLWHGFVVDVTDQTKAEQSVVSEATLRRVLIEQSRDGIVLLGENGQVREANRRYAEMLGYTPEEMLQLHVWDWDVQWNQTELEGQIRDLEADGDHFESQHRRKDGSIYDVEVSTSATIWNGEKLIFCLCRDISDRKRIERALRESETRFREVFDCASVGIFVHDAVTGEVLHANRSALESHGYAFEEFHSGAAFLPSPFSLADALERIHAAATGSPQRFEWKTRHRAGHAIWQDISLAPIVLDGRPCVLGMATDITARKRAERRQATQAAVSRVLAESDSLVDAGPRLLQAICDAEGWEFGALWELDARAQVMRATSVWHVMGEGLAELAAHTRSWTFARGRGLPGLVWEAGKPLLLSTESPEPTFFRGPEARRAGLASALGFPMLRGDAVVGTVDLLGRDMREPDPELIDLFSGIGHQLGQFLERRRAQAEIRRFVSGSPAVIYGLAVTDAGELRHVWTSDNATELVGYPLDDTRGDEWWRSNIHPDDRERVLASIAAPYDRDTEVIEYRFRRADGQYIWLHDEKRLHRRADGRPMEVTGSWLDVTARVQLEQQLRESQKMEAIGRLAGGVAHDFNNLLTIINGNIELLMAMVPAADPSREFLDDIQAAGVRAASLTGQLLAFSRRQVLEPKVVDLDEVVRGVESLLQRLLGEDVSLVTVAGNEPHPVRVDRAQLEQVIINLAVNARDAMPAGGRLTIETRSALRAKAASIARATVAPPTRYAQLVITDTGHGMTPEVKARIFEPFFTTKEPARGTGLGLATVFGVVQQSGGDIDVESEPGVGTRFTVSLPACDSTPVPTDAIVSNAPSHGGERILLVEDEAAVRRIARVALESCGYDIVEAENGPTALQLASQPNCGIDLVVTDVVMPGMSGRELVERLRALRPHLKVLYVSGYTDDAVVRHGVVDADVAFLHKPFSPGALTSKVRDVLDRADSSSSPS